MKWGLTVSLLLPYVAATLPPYKRFVSPLIHDPNVPRGLDRRLQEPRADGISWGACPGSSDDNIACGYYEVPLDWANPSSGKARLAVAKYGATNTPRKGVLLSNPGSPSPVVFRRAISTHPPYRRSW